MKQREFDFFVPKDLRGKPLAVAGKLNLSLALPENAQYLSVNPLENEEEFLGSQADSNRQEINYYDSDGKYLSTQELDRGIITSNLMHELERTLVKEY
ncbi:MAG: hypothetical protein AABX65_01675 [Nanoarchaeota archaeon]